MSISDHIARFLHTRNLSTKDIQLVVGLVRELEEVVAEKNKTIEAARLALRQQSQAVRSLTDNFLERQERRRELQRETAEDR